MIINNVKTESMLTTTKQKLPDAFCTEKKTQIEKSKHKTLGVTTDQHHTWNSHVHILTKFIAHTSYHLTKSKRIFDQDTRKHATYHMYKHIMTILLTSLG